MGPIASVVWRATTIALGFATVIAVFNIFAVQRPLKDGTVLVSHLGIAFATCAAGYCTYRVGYPLTSKAITLIIWRAAAIGLGSATVIALFYIFATPVLSHEYRSPLVLSLGLTFAAGAAGYSTYRVGYPSSSEWTRVLLIATSGIVVFALVLYLFMFVILNSVPA
jgi:hypothetical protein